jgi:tetratricopeptide (TPR) repeat protein
MSTQSHSSDARLMQWAVQCHTAGRLDEAEAIYRQILSRHPNDPDALHLLGIVAGQRGNAAMAVELISRAIAVRPSAAYFNSLGECYRRMGQPDRAAINFRRSLELDPLSVDALNKLGGVEKEMGDSASAIARFRQSVELKPEFADSYTRLGQALRESGHLEQAIVAFKEAARLQPDRAEAQSNLGVCLMESDRLDEAISTLRKAISLKPEFAGVHANLANALIKVGRFDEAIRANQRAVELNPSDSELHNNLGVSLAHNHCLDDAIAAYQIALQLKPENAQAHVNLAVALLLKGDLKQGFVEYEWRWKIPRRDIFPIRSASPNWNGDDVRGRTILLLFEQGFGDSIQFIRYAPHLAERGANIIVTCPTELAHLFQAVEGVKKVVSAENEVPPHDLQCPLASLPRLFGTTLESIPNRIPYLRPDPARSAKWKEKLRSQINAIRVGLAWAGRKDQTNDLARSMHLKQFAPLAKLRQVTFVSLQKGYAAAQSVHAPVGMDLLDFTEGINDFADTAARIDNLDLVISVDTATAHLAAAMGKPVWLLLSFSADWRWLLNKNDSPWYPTMRLFRQKRFGDWDEVITRVAQALGAMASERTKK